MDEKKKKDYWSQNSEGYLSIQKESRKVVLHPRIAEMIPRDKSIKILDYGYGDGSFILCLKPGCEVALYDINHQALYDHTFAKGNPEKSVQNTLSTP